MNTENEKIKTKIDAEIVNSNTKMYTVSVKVTEAQTNAPVLKGKVIVTSKKGKIVGSGKISKDGTATITSSISRKDYILTVHYEGTKKYDESKTKIDFQSEYLFYKTSFYLWTAIIGAIIIMLYIIMLNSYIVTTTPTSILGIFTRQFLPYLSLEPVTSLILMNTDFIQILINVLVWVLIISFIVASVYATQFNPNLHNIIRKNVTNHSLFHNFFIYIVEIIMFITIFAVILEYVV